MISLITINFNNAEATLELLKSLELQTDKDFNITVVDNDSVPGDRASLGEYASATPLSVDLLLSNTNRGFSGGNNLAARKLLALGSTWLVFINNDTTVPTDFIEVLRRELRGHTGIVGIPLREGSQISYAGIVQWLKSTLPHIHDVSLRDSIREPLYAIGGGVAVCSDALEQVGLWDERYFLYFEDADLSMRAREKGIPVSFIDAPALNHAVSRTTSRLGVPLLLRYHARNSLLFNSLHGPWWVRAILPFSILYGMVFQPLKTLLIPSRKDRSRAILSGILDFYGKRFGQISTHSDDRH